MEKLKLFFSKLNEKGIPIPMIRDPKNGRGSITITMFWVSFNIAILTLAGKVTQVIGDIDYSNVLWLLGLTGGMYLGRKIQGDGKKLTIDNDTNQ